MSYSTSDTIAAIATAAGGAARGIVRVSGSAAVATVAPWFEREPHDLAAEKGGAATRLAALSRPTAIAGSFVLPLVGPLNGSRDAPDSGLDDGARNSPRDGSAAPAAARLPCHLLVWPTARSYTREPVVEIHTLGSPPLLEAVLSAVCRSGARLAEPGEFTLRAFLAGRLDLTQAEAVLGVIDARGEAELSAALVQLAGGLARPLDRLRDDLLQLLAELEAGLDFVEEDIEFISADEVVARLTAALKVLEGVSRQLESRHTAPAAGQIVLVGRPNAGKSSLFNALVECYGAARSADATGGRQAAIVSPTRGTTRDYLTAAVDFGGVAAELIDTAGVEGELASRADDSRNREGRGDDVAGLSTAVDAAAQQVAAERSARAAIRVLCVDATEDARAAERWSAEYDVVVWTKGDLAVVADAFAAPAEWQAPAESAASRLPGDVELTGGAGAAPQVLTSSHTGQGLDELARALRRCLADAGPGERSGVVAATADRSRESVRRAAEALGRARETAASAGGDELVAVEIRAALDELGKVVGAVYTDDLLDRIFRTFCIGK